jgi:predicted Zn-dependent peptidase
MTMDPHPPREPRTTITTLSNGLTLVIVAQPHLHTSAAQLMVRAGSRYETAESAGLSHFVEHMLYRGSAAFPDAFALNRAFERRGGGLYAETGREITSYLVECPAESLVPLLAVLADAVIRPRWNDLEVEQRIVLEEILEDLDEHGQLIRADDVARRLAWPDHPFGLPITGTPDSVAGFTRADVEAHHGRFYCGDNAVLCVAGAVEHAEVQEAVAEQFADLPGGSRALPEPPARFTGPRLVHVDHAESQTNLDLVIQALPDSDPLNPAQSVLLRILDDGLSTRLHRRIVDELGLAYDVSASAEVLEDAVLLDFGAACAHDSTRPLLEAIWRLAAELRAAPPDDEEFQIARRRLLWDVQASYDSPRAMTEYYGNAALLRRNRALSVRVRQVLSATREDVHEVARRILRPDRLAAATVGRLTRAQQAALAELLEGDA